MKIKNIGIDAHNIRAGGGVTHLREVIKLYDSRMYNGSCIILWATKATLEQIPDSLSVVKKTNFLINFNILTRLFWHKFILKKDLIKNNCGVLFVPGGTYITDFKPTVTMSQNMLPFEVIERARYGFSFMYFKLLFLYYLQRISFNRADGVIFLTNYAKNYITNSTQILNANCIIPHGISSTFFKEPIIFEKVFSQANPLKIIYVSIIDVYKHQDIIAKAILELNEENIWVSVDFYGPVYGPAFDKLIKIINGSTNDSINYKGPINHHLLHKIIPTYDVFLFGSTCENMPNILLEGMAQGLPILCSNYGPMPEILENGGIYFDPLDVKDVKKSIKLYYNSTNLRSEKAKLSFNNSKQYSWERCSTDTFNFIKKIQEIHGE